MSDNHEKAQDLVRLIAESTCTETDSIEIETSIDALGVLIRLFVAEKDLGRIIGKGGENAKAIRTILRAVGSQNDARYSLKVQSRV